jgi:uncharacterized protein (TIGR02246 family)
MLHLTRGAWAASLALVMIAAASAADGASQRKEILALLTRVETTFAEADAKGLAACWTPTGVFIGPGGAETDGRDNIEKLFTAVRKDQKLLLHVEHFRLVNDSLALVDALSEMKPAPATGGTQMVCFVIVKQDGRWLIENARESSIHLPPQANPLKDLQWMAGDWASAASPAGVMLQTNCGWTSNQAFLIRKFKVQGKEAFLHGGTEIIGWDPRCQSIRSWVFDSDGGFGENAWVADGGHWVTRFSGTLADGSRVSATNIITKVDDDTVTIQSKDRAINGAAQPNIPEVVLKRQAAATAPVKVGEATNTPEKSP